MGFWPHDYDGAWTLDRPAHRSGIGLHSGDQVSVTLQPSSQPGVWVSWPANGGEPLKLKPSQVRDSPLCTTLELGDRKLATVEHLLAAIAGCGLTHVHLEVEGSEIPLLDGSSQGWVEAIAEAGLAPASTPAPARPQLQQPIALHRGSSVITATPAEQFMLVGVIDFPQPAIGRQQCALVLTPESFVAEIAPARTFGFREQVDQLRAAGLIQGGALDNALVCDGDQWLNPPLRYPDEPVRHKLLDLIGDLALVGFPRAQVLVYRGSHGLHTDLAAVLANRSDAQR